MLNSFSLKINWYFLNVTQRQAKGSVIIKFAY